MQLKYIFFENFRANSIKEKDVKEIAQGLKKLINLKSLTINLGQKTDPLRIHYNKEKNKTKKFLIKSFV